jgi:hypothetical protein
LVFIFKSSRINDTHRVKVINVRLILPPSLPCVGPLFFSILEERTDGRKKGRTIESISSPPLPPLLLPEGIDERMEGRTDGRKEGRTIESISPPPLSLPPPRRKRRADGRKNGGRKNGRRDGSKEGSKDERKEEGRKKHLGLLVHGIVSI